uniref:GLOBIN domain-containing protein n=1 Tax=Trichuris muris TaxID=70415 RepID=A0A5S6QVN9_TRIMR
MVLNLTPHQKQLLVQSWPQVQLYNRIHGGDAMFARFCEKNSIARETFQKIAVVQSFASNEASESVLKKHEQYLVQLLSEAVENLNNDCEPLLRECLDYGAQHVTLHELLNETVWEQLAEAIIDRIHKVNLTRYEKDMDVA